MTDATANHLSFKPRPDGGRKGSGLTGFGGYGFEVAPDADAQDCRIVTAQGDEVGRFRLDLSAATTPKPPDPNQGKQEGAKPIGPGTWIYHVLQAVSFGRLKHGLQCERRRKAMDKAGWRGLPGLWFRWVIRKTRG